MLSRLATFETYSARDLEGFTLLSGPKKTLSKGLVLRHEGAPNPEVYRLISGWLICSVTTPDGGRQITKVHLSGDLVGMPSMAGTNSMETIEAVTQAEVEVVSANTFGRVFRDYPRVAAMLFLWAQEERVRLMHQMTIVGRHQGTRRIAAFVLALYERVKLDDGHEDLSFNLPLTQPDLADATGMTAVHVNRCLKNLRQSGVLTITEGRAIIHDLEKLQRLVGMPALPHRNLSWI